MLKRISCDKFKTQPETFRAGLNVVLGSSDGSNAIGKSTFLLILDFVFGGDSYSKSAKDVIAHIEHHTINFEFEFDGKPYFFSRSTNRPTAVNRCDSKFGVIDEMKIADYRQWLFHEYKILLQGIGFAEIVERFFRIYTFDKHETITAGGLEIRNIDASRIEEDESAMIVFFKMNLSTGWDCPRAETMMSFRRASDYTYIAQLLGRMIRTPLARRVESDAELNDVGLFLPFFDENTVKMVEQALRDSEAIVPAETGSHKELITLKQNPVFADVFSSMDLITYRVDAARKQPALRRLIALARALTQDMISYDARKSTLKKVLDEFEKELSTLKTSGKFDEINKTVAGLALRTLTIDYGSDIESTSNAASEIIELSEFDMNNLFERAGKILGEGLHKEYWIRHSTRDAEETKTEIIVLTSDNDAMEQLELFADKLFNDLYDTHQTAFRGLKEERKDVYKKLALSSSTPIPHPWELQPTIDFTLAEDAQPYENHLYIPVEGKDFKISLNDWEGGIVKEELKKGDFVAWLRNLDRKKWSLEIPYEVDGVKISMFPDIVVVRADAHGYVFDVLEPHDPSRKDNYPKAVGLAKFAENHGEHFGRIQLIRKAKGADRRDHFYRLDMGRLNIRNKVRGVTSNTELDRIFDEDAVTE